MIEMMFDFSIERGVNLSQNLSQQMSKYIITAEFVI